MKKLTAGILTVLLGIVSANSADAAVASKGYVDAKAAAEATAAKDAAADALSTAKSELEGKINAKVAQTDYDNKVAALEAADETFATKDSMTTELSKKQNNLTVTGDVLTWDAETSTLGLTGIATDASVKNLQNTVNKLDGNAETEGSVKKQIADAIASEVQRSNTAYATAAQGALANSAVQFDDIATADKTGVVKSGTSVSVAADGTLGVVFGDASDTNTTLPVTGKAVYTAISNSKSELGNELSDVAATASAADTLSKSNKTAIDAINNGETGILKQAQTYADGLAGNYATAAQGAKADTALQRADIATGSAQGTISVKGENVTVNGLGTAAYTDATAYDAAGSASDAEEAAKKYTDDEIVELGLQPISKVPASCANAANYCVLTTNGSTFVWEVVARADGEVGGSAEDVTE